MMGALGVGVCGCCERGSGDAGFVLLRPFSPSLSLSMSKPA